MILRTTYTGNGQSLVEDKRFYYAQNWRADVSVVLDDAGVQQERVIYSTCGQPFAMPAGDTNFDGDFEAGVDGNELADWDINGVPYRAYADVNLDGDIDGADATAASARDLGWNVLTSGDVENRLGYAGYIHDRDVATAAHVRHRVYKIDLGRWVQRDPAGYVDGMSLYEYVRSAPTTRSDPDGLQANAPPLPAGPIERCTENMFRILTRGRSHGMTCGLTLRNALYNCCWTKVGPPPGAPSAFVDCVGDARKEYNKCSNIVPPPPPPPTVTPQLPPGPASPTTRPPDCFTDNKCNKLDRAQCLMCCQTSCPTGDHDHCGDWCASPFYVPLGPSRSVPGLGGGVSID